MMYAIFILVVAWISTGEADKFDFPEHLIGTNYSVIDDLHAYLHYNPVDLGMDILDEDAPMHIRNALSNATLSDDVKINQYPPYIGVPIFLESLAKFYSKLIGHELDPEKNVLATSGATGAAYDAFLGHTSIGDEWIIIQPAYIMYLPMIHQARGIPRFTNLKLTKKNNITGDDWVIDREEMESLFNNKTKGILLNNPLNPIGKVYTLEELEFIAYLAKKYNTLVISDEAHEWVTHKPHIRIASLPGMFNRTITIGSSSKSFSVGGWRVGWAYGPANILNNLKTVNKRSSESAAAPQQVALAFGFQEAYDNFGKPDSFFATRLAQVKEKRDRIVKVFEDVGMKPITADAGYCMMVDWTTLKNKPLKNIKGGSLAFVKWLIKHIGVLGLPVSEFYAVGHQHLGDNYVRFCFHKHENTLQTATQKLQKLKLNR